MSLSDWFKGSNLFFTPKSGKDQRKNRFGVCLCSVSMILWGSLTLSESDAPITYIVQRKYQPFTFVVTGLVECGNPVQLEARSVLKSFSCNVTNP